MRLRVRSEAEKGHMVAGEMVQPGDELPGEHDAVPPGLENKLEPVPSKATEKKIAELKAKAEKLRAEADEVDAQAVELKAAEEQKLIDEAAKAKAKADAKARGVSSDDDEPAKMSAGAMATGSGSKPAHEAKR